jgi:hypothetical protein
MKAPSIALIIGLSVTAPSVAQEMPGEHGGMDHGNRSDSSGEQTQGGSMDHRMMQGRMMGMHRRMNMNDDMDEDMGMRGGRAMMCPMMCPMMRPAMARDAMDARMMEGRMSGGGMMHGGDGRFDMMRGGMSPGNRESGLFGSRVRPVMNLSAEDVRSYLDSQLARLNNKRLKVGSLNAEDNIITAEVVTLDNSLVQRLKVDRHTGRIDYVD